MHQSHVIEIDGVFVGAAVRLADGYRFKAVDARVGGIDGSVWPSREAVQRAARRSLQTHDHAPEDGDGSLDGMRRPTN